MEFSLKSTDEADRRVPRIALVVPCYNEEAVLRRSAAALLKLLSDLNEAGHIDANSRLCFVDDGSEDATWQIVHDLTRQDARCCGMRLTRNFGHQNALLAGLMSVPGDLLVSLDADLQDDPSAIPAMLSAYRRGADIVYAVRDTRSSDSWWKRTSAEVYYKLLRAMGVRAFENHADYRLISRRAVESLRKYREANLFLRGLVTDLGYPHAVVTYSRQARVAGETKYSLPKMLALGLDGITSFSAMPLRLIAAVGTLVFVGSLLVSAWALGVRLFTDNAVPGWASSVVPMYFLGGIQLLSIGILGEYISKIYLETKARPRFLLQETCGIQDLSPSLD